MPLFEKAPSLASSKLWRLLSDLYEKEAAGSWQEVGVPFYLTSTPKLAKQWAEICLSYFLELREKEPSYGSAEHPWIIIEVGSGAGRFAYLFLRFFEQFLADSKEGPIFWKYLMMDISQPVVDSWSHHPWLSSYWQKGHLMSARFDLDQKKPVVLTSGHVLNAGSFKFPVAMLAGYLFDTLPVHSFRVEFGNTLGLGIEVHAPQMPEEVGSVSFLRDMNYNFFETEEAFSLFTTWTQKNGYEKSAIDLMSFYEKVLEEGQAWTLSTGALDCFARIQELSPSGFLALTGDQGMGDVALLKDHPRVVLGRHGSISCPVNYHGLAFILESMGHKAILSHCGSHKFITLAAFVGVSAKLTHSIARSQRLFDEFDNVNYWALVNKILEMPSIDLDLLELTLKVGDWDPINFFHLMPTWKLQIVNARDYQKEKWKGFLRKIEAQFFPISKQEAVLLNEMGVCFSLLGDWQGAKKTWEKALACNNELAPAWLNLAIVCMHEGNEDLAGQLFLKAEALNPQLTAHLPIS